MKKWKEYPRAAYPSTVNTGGGTGTGSGEGEKIPDEGEGTDWRKIAMIGIPSLVIVGVGLYLAFGGKSESAE